MPSRIIKESICTSEDIAMLSMGAEILFYRLMVKADDFGIYHGNETLIKNICFPLKSDEIKLNQVKSWLAELCNAGLIFRYMDENGKIYLKLTKWERHQQIRAKKSKFPAYDSACMQLISDEIKLNQKKSSDCKCSRNPIQSNPIQPRKLGDAQMHAANDFELCFERLWDAYPRKKGKNAVKPSTKQKLYDAGETVVMAAIERYRHEIAEKHTDEQYILHGSTFFNGRWQDYAVDTAEESSPKSDDDWESY